MADKVKAKSKPKKVKQSLEMAANGRPILYPSITTEVAQGPDALTIDRIKSLLGWETESDDEGEKFGTDYLLIDEEGRKVRCVNDVNNRPLYSAIVKNLMQEHLMKRWVFNGEPIIIGRTGIILNGQHTLVSAVLADQVRNGDSKNHWDEVWGEDGQVVLEKLVVFGIDESDNTVNTMDLCKPRSLADVIYRSEFFAKMKGKDRKTVSRLTDYAIRFLWYRMGVGSDPFAPRRTHSEALDFLMRHETVLKAVKHIFDEDSEKSISKYVPAGIAAAMLYLMASGLTDGDAYRNADKQDESIMDLSQWDKACDFWVALSATSDQMKEVRYAIGSLADPDTGLGGSNSEKVAIICKAWALFLEGKKIDKKSLKLAYHVDDEGINHLTEFPDVGGCDLGDPKEKEEKVEKEEEESPEEKPAKKKGRKKKEEVEEIEEDVADDDGDVDTDDDDDDESDGSVYADPTPDEIEEAKAEARRARAEEIAAKLKASRAKGKGKVKPVDDDEDSDD